MTSSQAILQTIDDHVLTITMNRPERKNALSREILVGLMAAFTDAADNADVRAIVLRGAGGAFCVGGDLQRMAGEPERPPYDEAYRGMRKRVELVRVIHEHPKPVIAMIDGAAAGAGLALALACDLRIAADTAKITTAFVKAGLSGDYGGTYFITQLLGAAKARELYLLSPIMSGKEAAAIGLVTRAVPAAELEQATREIATNFAKGPTLTYGFLKKNLNRAEASGLGDCLEEETRNHLRCAETADHKEAARAFVEKRPPSFAGR